MKTIDSSCFTSDKVFLLKDRRAILSFERDNGTQIAKGIRMTYLIHNRQYVAGCEAEVNAKLAFLVNHLIRLRGVNGRIDSPCQGRDKSHKHYP